MESRNRVRVFGGEAVPSVLAQRQWPTANAISVTESAGFAADRTPRITLLPDWRRYILHDWRCVHLVITQELAAMLLHFRRNPETSQVYATVSCECSELLLGRALAYA